MGAFFGAILLAALIFVRLIELPFPPTDFVALVAVFGMVIGIRTSWRPPGDGVASASA
jgi:xanthosine utilization system XapX-like protein